MKKHSKKAIPTLIITVILNYYVEIYFLKSIRYCIDYTWFFLGYWIIKQAGFLSGLIFFNCTDLCLYKSLRQLIKSVIL